MTSQSSLDEAINQILETYVEAFEAADADQMAALFWLEDPRFKEVENHIAEPFGSRTYMGILDWIRKHQEPGWRMLFYDTCIYPLGDDVAYSISMRDTDENGHKETSRVSLLYLRKGGEWRIIHGHFSHVPG
jgi:ketosteroid isomerase-like protein